MAAPERYDHAATALIRAVVSLARDLGIRTVAEGVETQQQAQKLDELKCDLQQGFLHARPMSARDLDKWALTVEAERPRVSLVLEPRQPVFEL